MFLSGLNGSGAEALDACQNVVCRLRPSEGFGIVIDGVDVILDGLFQFLRGAMNTASQLLFGQQGKQALDLVQPRSAGRGEVDMPVRPLGEPCSDGWGLVGGVIVHDQMDIEIVRHIGIDLTKKRQKFLGAVSLEASSDHLAGGNIEGGEERRRAMPLIVVSAPFSLTWPHRQERLCPIERLDLALFIDAQHQSALGRVEIKPDNVPHLLDEKRVSGKLERLAAMRL